PLKSFKRLLLSGRGLIETAIGQLKEICQIQHTRHRSPNNFLANLFAGLLAYALKPKKSSLSWKNRLSRGLLTSS
ncbi:MAG: transposase, partial [Alphaproteobacteria bacterium]